MQKQLTIGQLASASGVSTRTLRHYDAIGLLNATDRTEAGYRVYREQDLLTIQQILTLKYLGLELSKIKDLLNRSDFEIETRLRIQIKVIDQQIEDLGQIRSSLSELTGRFEASGVWDWDQVHASASKLSRLTNEKEKKVESHFTPEQMQQATELRDELGDEYITNIQDRWAGLMSDIEQAGDLDVTSELAKSFLDRWNALTKETMDAWSKKEGLPEAITQGYENNSYETVEQAPKPAMFELIQRIEAAQ